MRATGKVGMALLVFGAGVGIGRWGPPSSTGSAARGTATARPNQSLPIQVQAATDGDSPSQSILTPLSCVVTGSMVAAKGTYSGLAEEYYRRIGAVVELYVYSAPTTGYPDGIQLGLSSQEKPAMVLGGSRDRWETTVPFDAGHGPPARCAVTVQATHQPEYSPSDY